MALQSPGRAPTRSPKPLHAGAVSPVGRKRSSGANGERRSSGVKKDVAKIIQLFKSCDTDGDGSISKPELRRLMRFVTDGAADDATVDRLMEAADLDRSGSIDLQEFVKWVFDPKIGLSQGGNPSEVDVSNSPMLINALKDWFAVLDSNRNGTIEYEEFAVAKLLMGSVDFDSTVDAINEDFKMFDQDRNRKVSRGEFLDENLRLLRSIPRTIEEKVELINTRKLKLLNATKAAEFEGMKGLSAEDFVTLLKEKFKSIEDAFVAMDTDKTDCIDIVKLAFAVERFLELKEGLSIANGSGVSLLMVRSLFRELDPKSTGRITLAQFSDVERRIAKQAKEIKAFERVYTKPKEISAAQHAIDEGLPKKGDIEDVVRKVVSLWQKQLAEPRCNGRASLAQAGAQQVASPKLHSGPASGLPINNSPRPSSAPSNRLQSLQFAATGSLSATSPIRSPSKTGPTSPMVASRRGSMASGGASGRGCVTGKRVSRTEFEAVLCSCLSQLPGFQEHVREYGNKVAVRIHLQGWSIMEIFDRMDTNGDGFIAVEEWRAWLCPG